MFLDSSAIISLLIEEADAPALERRLEQATTKPMTSPIVVVETAVNLSRIKNITIPAAQEAVAEFLDVLKVETIPITPEIGKRALQAYAQYGKGAGHPARLNFADVFSYACAKSHNVPLLYKGNDFTHTDLADPGRAGG